MDQSRPGAVSGVLIVNKHEGVTSHRIISACRKLFDTRQVGHTGTLDPMATGVLPVLIGRAVKASEYLVEHDKEYLCTLRLGLTTDTEDVTGEVLAETDEIPGEEEVFSAVASFVGTVSQIPPMYSAVKVGGKKLVDIARSGGEVERTPREVEIYSAVPERLDERTYSIRIHCSKGTYIRTLCADIGRRLGCGGAMASLIRLRSGTFTLGESVTVAELESMSPEERVSRLLPVESLFGDLPSVDLPDFFARLLRCGADVYQKKVHTDYPDGTMLRARNRGRFFALGRAVEAGEGAAIRLEKLFVLDDGT